MTHTLTIAGLQWRHHGPSFFELAGHPAIEVAYLGDSGTGADWFLFLDDAGTIKVEAFASRDQACACVAEAFGIQ